jgi:hypothetical protein
MQDYRIFVVDKTGEVLLSHDVQFSCDEDVQHMATCLCHLGARVEVWRGAALVCQVRSKSPTT